MRNCTRCGNEMSEVEEYRDEYTVRTRFVCNTCDNDPKYQAELKRMRDEVGKVF
jgi:transposase-like protein